MHRAHSTPRVLHVLSTISFSRGGPSVAVRNMVKALKLRGIQADVITTDDDGPDARVSVPHGRFLELEGQRVMYFPRQSQFYYSSWPLLSWLSRHLHRYDIVHTHGLFAFAPIVAARVAKQHKVPYIMRPAGMLDSWGRENRRPILKRGSIAFVERPLLSSAARVHFTSGIELNQAREIGAPMRSVVLPLGLDLDDTPADLARTSTKRVLYLSRIDYKKGLDVLIRAFALVTKEHRDAVLLIAGDGPRPLVDSLRYLSTELNISQNISWLGFVQGAAKQDVLARSNLFALTSKSENFGVAAAEAMAAGLPLVVTQGVALSDLVARANCGLVTDGSVQQVAAAIKKLLSDEALRTRMSICARQAAAAEFSLHTFGARLESLYREVLA